MQVYKFVPAFGPIIHDDESFEVILNNPVNIGHRIFIRPSLDWIEPVRFEVTGICHEPNKLCKLQCQYEDNINEASLEKLHEIFRRRK